eukprot:c9429_g1_i1.p1 GENE.c9429_g1_i1~~c9429_g1_i1.p1  ORF type:complete len:1242 (-),score=332.04 c9429_g1_i1:14-3328(-)
MREANSLADSMVAQVTCPVRLTKRGYWCNPSLDNLSKMTPEQLKSVVDFEVGREGYGSVKFFGATDLNSKWVSDLDHIVIFEEMGVEVYPSGWSQELPKPEQGQGLNKRALITLERCFARDKETGRPTTSTARIEAFTRKLQDKVQTTFQGEFQSYDAQTGRWKFIVNHFSRYGLEDDDVEDDAQPAQQPQQEQHHEPIPTSSRFGLVQDDILEPDEQMSDSDDGSFPTLTMSRQSLSDSHRFAFGLGIREEELSSMSGVLFPTPPSAAPFRMSLGPTPRVLTFEDEQEQSREVEEEFVQVPVPIPQQQQQTEFVVDSNYILNDSQPLWKLEGIEQKPLPFDETVNGYHNRESQTNRVVDPALMFSRSFRVGWMVLQNVAELDIMANAQESVGHVIVFANVNTSLQNTVVRPESSLSLRTQVSFQNIQSQTVTPNLFHRMRNVSSALLAVDSEHVSNNLSFTEHLGRYMKIFENVPECRCALNSCQLIQALWDRGSAEHSLLEDLDIRQKVLEWLRTHLRPTTRMTTNSIRHTANPEPEAAVTAMQSILRAICGGDMENAVSQALSIGCYHLACALASSACKESRDVIRDAPIDGLACVQRLWKAASGNPEAITPNDGIDDWRQWLCFYALTRSPLDAISSSFAATFEKSGRTPISATLPETYGQTLHIFGRVLDASVIENLLQAKLNVPVAVLKTQDGRTTQDKLIVFVAADSVMGVSNVLVELFRTEFGLWLHPPAFAVQSVPFIPTIRNESQGQEGLATETIRRRALAVVNDLTPRAIDYVLLQLYSSPDTPDLQPLISASCSCENQHFALLLKTHLLFLLESHNILRGVETESNTQKVQKQLAQNQKALAKQFSSYVHLLECLGLWDCALAFLANIFNFVDAQSQPHLNEMALAILDRYCPTWCNSSTRSSSREHLSRVWFARYRMDESSELNAALSSLEYPDSELSAQRLICLKLAVDQFFDDRFPSNIDQFQQVVSAIELLRRRTDPTVSNPWTEGVNIVYDFDLYCNAAFPLERERGLHERIADWSNNLLKWKEQSSTIDVSIAQRQAIGKLLVVCSTMCDYVSQRECSVVSLLPENRVLDLQLAMDSFEIWGGSEY